MPLVVGTDAYATVEEVGAYLTSRGIAGWGSDAAKQEAAIREATAYLDVNFEWVGCIADRAQALGWPRTNAYDREGRYISGIPGAVKNATAELAVLALTGRLQPMQLAQAGSSVVKSERIGDVQVTYDNAAGESSADYSLIRNILRGLGGMRSDDSGTLRLRRV